MTAFIMRASKYTRIGGVVLQALNLALIITEQFAKGKTNGSAKQPGTEAPQDGE